MRTVATIPVLAAVLVAALTACGGGSGAVQPSASARHSISTKFTFTVPAAGALAKSRRADYVSPATRSISVDVLYPSAPRVTTIANFAADAPGCSSAPNFISCAVVVTTEDAAKTFVLTAFDAPNGGGSALSTATIPVPPLIGNQTDVDVTLDGIVRSVTFSLQGSLTQGTAASFPLLVIAKDAAGAIIVGPGAYTVPITLQNGDPSGAFAISATTVGSPGTTVTLTYNGKPSNGTTINANAGTSTLGSATIGFGATPGPTSVPTPVPTPSPSPTATPVRTSSPTPAAPVASPTSIAFNAVGQSQQVLVTEANYAGLFTATSSNTAVAAVTPSSSAGAFTVTATGAGSATITFTDAARQSVTVAVDVTATGLVVQGHR